jgi:hypothetical protein
MKAVLVCSLILIVCIVTAHSNAAEFRGLKHQEIKFEYEMPLQEVERLESRVLRLRKGNSLQEVKTLLGKPTSERILRTKPLFGAAEFVSKELVYLLKSVHVNENNVKDHSISLYFDRSERLVSIERLGYSLTGTYKIVGGVQIVERILE